MLNRPIPLNQFPSKNQEISITLKDGRTFTVCGKGQYAFILAEARRRMAAILTEENEPVTQETIEKRVREWAENECRYAPLGWILSQMPPDDAEEWKKQYRFQGIWHSKKS
jgi:hypothetical protein